MRMPPAEAPPGAGVLAAPETDILTTANVSRSSTGAISGAYRSGERSAKSATSRPYQPAANRPTLPTPCGMSVRFRSSTVVSNLTDGRSYEDALTEAQRARLGE